MRRVLADADAEETILVLGIDPDGPEGLDKVQLRRWYQRLGFEEWMEDTSMIRYPNR
jgi:hypothetical protein